MAKTSPTQRTIAHLKKLGYVAPAIVEKWNPHVGIRQDLWGWCDIVAIEPGRSVPPQHDDATGYMTPPQLVFVQCTTQANASARVAKIQAWDKLPHLLGVGVRVEVWGWAKRGARGKRKLWSVRRVRVVGLKPEDVVEVLPLLSDKPVVAA